jgi:hypothetical protein
MSAAISEQVDATCATPLMQAALGYAARGWPVVPLRVVDDINRDGRADRKYRPLIKWRTEASTDPEKIREWWTRWPDARIGVRTGPKPEGGGIFGLDIDGAVGRASLARLEAEIGPLPPTLTTITARGFHKIIDLPFGRHCRTVAPVREDLPALDVRGDGGLLVMPPSLHKNGEHVYRFEEDRLGPAAPSEKLLDFVAKKPKKQQAAPVGAPRYECGRAPQPYLDAALREEVEKVRQAVPGARNSALNEAAFSLGQLVPHGLDEATARAELEGAAEACGLVGDDGQRSVQGTIESGIEAGKKEPRSTPPPVDRPKIQVIPGLGHVAVTKTIAALSADPTLFVRDRKLVTIAGAEAEREADSTRILRHGTPTIVLVSEGDFWRRVSSCACYVRHNKKENADLECDPPSQIVRSTYEAGDWPGLRRLRGVSTAPVLRADGSLFRGPGFDDASTVVATPSTA